MTVAWMTLAVVLSGLIAGSVLWLLSSHGLVRPIATPQGRPDNARFLVRNGTVVDEMLAPGRQSIFPEGNAATWDCLRSLLANRFDGLPIELTSLNSSRQYYFHARTQQDKALLSVIGVGKGHLVTLDDPEHPSAETDLAKVQPNVFQQAMESAPGPAFALDDEGALTWSNASFDQFKEYDRQTLVVSLADTSETDQVSHVLEDPDTGHVTHLEVTCCPIDGLRVFHIVDVTRLIDADRVRNAFVQTLTKTFANLATGLAVFDWEQRLVLFNPAIVDLTGLSAEFLSGRPDVLEFFDRLRDAQVMPEPKDYKEWRKRTKTMLKSAADGDYSERWSLPCGKTYQVTGRPHPDGAVAFVFEDLTDELSITRQSRQQVEIRQAVLDQVDDAIAVFGPDDTLMFCNRGFEDLFGIDPDSGFAQVTLRTILAIGRASSSGAETWDRIAQHETFDEPVEVRVGLNGEDCLVWYQSLSNGFRLLKLVRLLDQSLEKQAIGQAV